MAPCVALFFYFALFCFVLLCRTDMALDNRLPTIWSTLKLASTKHYWHFASLRSISNVVGSIPPTSSLILVENTNFANLHHRWHLDLDQHCGLLGTTTTVTRSSSLHRAEPRRRRRTSYPSLSRHEFTSASSPSLATTVVAANTSADTRRRVLLGLKDEEWVALKK